MRAIFCVPPSELWKTKSFRTLASIMTILALEEIGKAALLGIWHIAQATGDETGSFDKRLDEGELPVAAALRARN
jgi:hypothetical protein